MWSSGRFNRMAEYVAELPAPIEVRLVRSARRLRLRYDEARGVLKLTCPPRTSRRSALAWALDQREWIEEQVARRQPGEPLVPGAIIPIAGCDTRLIWSEAEARSPRLNDGELRCGGPRGGFERRITGFLKRLALETLSREVEEFAAAAGVRPTGVSIGDAGTRWGSCSSAGRIRLSWRLILAPPDARRYVVSHEVAHLMHLNHGPLFKALEAELFGPGLSDAKATLRRVGPRLRRIGRLG